MDPVYRLPPWKTRSIFSTLAEVIDWSMTMIGAPEAWKVTRGAYTDPDTGEKKQVKVLVIDTGVQLDPNTGRANHPDLAGNLGQGRDFTGSPEGLQDKQGHGTATASLIMAKNDGKGIIGVASEALVHIAKGLGDDGSGDNRGIAAAVDWGDELDVDIISFSGGSPEPDPTLEAAIKRFLGKRKGRFFVAAAGNDGLPNSVNYPAAWPFVLAVGAVDRNGVTAPFSSRGAAVDIAGPGQGVKAAAIPSRHGSFDGTSFACPIMAGVVALMVAKHKGKKTHKTPLDSIDDLLGHLKAVADQLGSQAVMEEQGFGIVRADLMLAREDEPEVPTTPNVVFDMGLFTWSIPARAGDLVSIGIAETTHAKKAQAVALLGKLAESLDKVELVPAGENHPAE